MVKRTISYTDFNNVQRTEDFYFNLTKAEITAMELSVNGGLVATIEKIVAEQNGKEIIALFQSILEKSYGEKTLDGRSFIKDPERFKLFAATEAYSILFMELATDAEKAAAFINGIVPAPAQETK